MLQCPYDKVLIDIKGILEWLCLFCYLRLFVSDTWWWVFMTAKAVVWGKLEKVLIYVMYFHERPSNISLLSSSLTCRLTWPPLHDGDQKPSTDTRHTDYRLKNLSYNSGSHTASILWLKRDIYGNDVIDVMYKGRGVIDTSMTPANQRWNKTQKSWEWK